MRNHGARRSRRLFAQMILLPLAIVLGLTQPMIGWAPATAHTARPRTCTSENLEVVLDDAASALAEGRPAGAAAMLVATLEACSPNSAVPEDYHAWLRVAALAALASHRAGDDAACRSITGNDKAIRYLYGAASLEELDDATAAALEDAPTDALALLFRAVALCPAEQRVCAEPVWSNTRLRVGEMLKREDYEEALNIFFEAFARCAADPLDDRAYRHYVWAISDAALTARKAGDIQACKDLLRRDPALRHILGETSASDLAAEAMAEFVAAANAVPAALNKALRVNARQCQSMDRRR